MIIDGKKIATQKLEDLKSKIQTLGIRPKLNIVTDQPDSVFVRQKMARGQEVGIGVTVTDKIDLAADGIIVQLPHPQADELIAQIPPEKDVDGLTGKSKFLPAAVSAVLICAGDVTGKTIVIVGQGRLIGKPLADYWENMGLSVVRCDVNTPDLKEQTLSADVLVVATGQERLITAEMVKKNAIVIDCGAPRPEVDPSAAAVGAITPVPGGVGPLTVACLLENVFEAAKISKV
ncbi:MAG: bifunctional 5,10-methylenetetrahydrofolate dehydrogenase/5,10-methenyltetrahydrofolate cyclohydrolase [Patescibacteria group bacterium]|nr:bifunctional 5,10-methylenetetrahydrofolate dehydrogenase/5,10-methenyltetrahydrofolate cyclohydrolase [Patescibacteria group bacterium]MCL5432184.1 bifunctional 5,10-methylenetetrahydrofolate dehydrogenase/5,10-methenyltetrahydrofolate cyclohydrolase [Patescibacteria group bacterium]